MMESGKKNGFVDLFFSAREIPDSNDYKEALFEIQKLIHNYIKSRVKAAEDIDDLTQEILTGIHKSRLSAESEQKFLGFIYAIARYKLADFMQNKKLRNKVFLDLNNESNEVGFVAFITFSKMFDPEAELHLKQLESQLTMIEKKVIRGLKTEGLTVSQLAEELGITIDAVKSIAYRSRKKIKEYFL